MRIALFGGVFGSAMADYALSAPEVVLRRFLAADGHDVVPVSSAASPFGIEADVFHAHHFGPAAYALALGGVGPFVFTSHNPFLVSSFDADESRLESILQGRVLRRADAVVALSSREADLLAQRFGIPRDRFAVIPNGLDLRLYAAPAARNDGPLRLLSVGQLTAYKGHVHLLDAVAALTPRFPDLRLEIVSHVRDPENHVLARAAALGLTDRLDLTGPFGTAELVDRYRACDVYVQPSLAECFPVTVLEAMACGRPVVATDVGGVAEEVGDAGVVVPPADPTALAAALEPLLDDAARRASLGRAARERAVALYGGQNVAAEHERLYASLAGRRRRGSVLGRAATRGSVALYRRRGRIAALVPAAVRRRSLR